jgi:hypothetical protein
LPDFEERYWRRFRDRGLMVVGVNPGGRGGIRGDESTDPIGGVQRFTQRLGITYPIGLEDTANYLRFTENFRGSNPFPVDVVVDRDGTIAYIAREYDPAALSAVIEKLLARPAGTRPDATRRP